MRPISKIAPVWWDLHDAGPEDSRRGRQASAPKTF